MKEEGKDLQSVPKYNIKSESDFKKFLAPSVARNAIKSAITDESVFLKQLKLTKLSKK